MLSQNPVSALARGLLSRDGPYIPDVLQGGPVPCFQEEKVPEHLASQYAPLLLSYKQAGLWLVQYEAIVPSGGNQTNNLWLRSFLGHLHLGFIRLTDESYVIILENRADRQALLVGQIYQQHFIISGQFQHRRRAPAPPASLPARPCSADLLNRLCTDYALGAEEAEQERNPL